MPHSRPALAVLAMTAIILASGLLLPDLGRSAAWSVGESILVFFLAATAGAWLARSRFVVPALLAWAVFWTAVIGVLHLIAAPAGGSSIAATLQFNWLAIVLSGAATVAGALCGHILAGSPDRPLVARHTG